MKKGKNPVISVVMSVYNSEKYLEEAIESILNQTFKDFEFIIINDGSKDDSLKIIKKYAKKDKRIKVINNVENIGLTRSLNKGLEMACGEYIARMDADDVSMPERFQVQYDYLEKNKDIFLVGSAVLVIDDSGKDIYSNKKIDNDVLIKKLVKHNAIVHSSIVFRRGLKYREKFFYSQDYDLYLRIISDKQSLHVLGNFLVKYRSNSKSISAIKNEQQKLLAKKALEFFYERKRSGGDSYSIWDNQKILKINNKDEKVFFIQRCIESQLSYGTREKIGNYISEYKLLKGHSKFRCLAYEIFYRIPLSYTFYRKFFYRDNK